MKKKLRRSAVSVSRLSLAGLIALSSLYGCVEEPAPFDPAEAQRFERYHDSEVKDGPKYPLPTTAETPYVNGVTTQPSFNRYEGMNPLRGPAVKLSLQDVVHRAMLNNMEVRVASYDTAIDQTRILEAQGNFDPSLIADSSFQRIDKMTPGTEVAVLNSNASQNTTSVNAFHDIVVNYDQEALSVSDFGFKQNLPAGGQVKLTEEITSTWTNPTRGILQSFYQNDLLLTLTQPVLQNFGLAVNQARITIAQNNSRVSLLDFRNTVEKTVLSIEQTYWQLVQAQRDVESTKDLIRNFKVLQYKLYHRYQRGGDVNESQLFQVNAETSRSEGQLIQLEYRVATLSSSLKQLMNDPSYPVAGDAIVVATDDGTELPMRFNLDDQIETAMNNRYELGQQQLRVASAEIAILVAKNNMLPQLDIQLSGDVDGLGRHIENAFSEEGNFNHLGYQAGFQFSYALGDRAATAIWQRSILQRLQAIMSYVGLVNQISLDVRNASLNVDQSWYFLDKARQSRLYYEQALSRLEEQYEKGDQPYTFDSLFIELQDRQSLLQAEQTEHQALNDYNFALATLEKAKGTILRYDNVLMEQEQFPPGMDVKGGQLAHDLWLGTLKQQSDPPVMPLR